MKMLSEAELQQLLEKAWEHGNEAPDFWEPGELRDYRDAKLKELVELV